MVCVSKVRWKGASDASTQYSGGGVLNDLLLVGYLESGGRKIGLGAYSAECGGWI